MEKVPKKEIRAALKKGGRFNNITVYNRFFETVDVWVYNAGLQAKTDIYMKIRETNGIFCNT